MSRPAARVGDPHICPSVDPAPHVGGPVQPRGFPRVQIEAKPAARAGDLASCMTSRRDAILEGSGTVLIGGRPAARLHEKTGHGGRVMGGAWTVRIGGPTVSPPGLAELVEKLEEMDRLREDIERREKRIKDINETERRIVDPTPEEKLKDDFFKIFDLKDDEVGAPSGTSGQAERQGIEDALRRLRAERERLKLENTVEGRKLKKLEQEVQEQADAPFPVPPKPPKNRPSV
ncbi:MAG: PAAR domain-containing protein [Polyangiaceae bacterium]